jgi:hypothetical protein
MDCDEEREGYVNSSRPAYPAIHAPVQSSARQRHASSCRTEGALGGLITIAAGAWAVYVVTFQNGNLWQLQFSPPGPIEICALGVLIWLHAKWRHSAKVD